MKTLVLLSILVMSGTAKAQWLNYPTPNVPRNADGSPNLNAPAPRTYDGKPDLSGLWIAERNRPCPPEIGCADMEVGQEFIDIGWSLKGGLPLQPWAAAAKKARMAENGKEDPASSCKPGGLVKFHTNPLYQKYVQTPGLLLLLTERDKQFRQIFTDGRPLPQDPQPAADGYSTGKWDGDVLVVESNGFQDGTWLDRNGNPLTEAAHITEHFSRPTFGVLQIELTVNDPKAYTKPWTVSMKHLIALNTEMIDYFCNENEQDAKHLFGK